MSKLIVLFRIIYNNYSEFTIVFLRIFAMLTVIILFTRMRSVKQSRRARAARAVRLVRYSASVASRADRA